MKERENTRESKAEHRRKMKVYDVGDGAHHTRIH